jgi:hypothetical protein
MKVAISGVEIGFPPIFSEDAYFVHSKVLEQKICNVICHEYFTKILEIDAEPIAPPSK